MTANTNKPLVAIVDDCMKVCLSIKRLVGGYGLEARTFTSGADFLDTIDTTPSFKPDCVILDVQMPDLNGLQVQTLLGRRLPGTPVIFVTGLSEGRLYEAAQAAGPAAVIQKPFDAEALVSAVRTSLLPNWIS